MHICCSVYSPNLVIVLLFSPPQFCSDIFPITSPRGKILLALSYPCMALAWQLLLSRSRAIKGKNYVSLGGNWSICLSRNMNKKTHNPRSRSQPSCGHDGKQPEEKANTPKISEQRGRKEPVIRFSQQSIFEQ